MRNFKEREEKWRRLLGSAKPEGWKWQPPEEVEAIEPKEPPQNIKAKLDEVIAKLPGTEREMLILRFVDGLSAEEIAQMLGSKKVFVLVIERGAVERLAEWLEAKEHDVYSWLTWWGEKKTEAILAELQNLPLMRTSPECISLERLYVANLRWDWTEQEKQHINSCNYCRRMNDKVKSRLWHPSSSQLWQYVTQGKLSEEERLKIRYHLETDECRRCKFVAEKVFGVIAPVFQPTMQRWQVTTKETKTTEREVLYLLRSLPSREIDSVFEKPQKFTTPVVAALPIPVNLSVEGFAGEVQEEVEVEEGLFHAKLTRTEQGWVARAEAVNVPAGSKVLFVWLAPDGSEKFKAEAEFKPAFRDWSYAEAVLAGSEVGQLGEGYFVAAILPTNV